MGVPVFDQTVMDFVQLCCHNAVTDTIFPVITYLGEIGVFWLALAVILLFCKATRRWGMAMLLAMAATALLGEALLKNIICRPRPFQLPSGAAVSLLIVPPSGYSFPSGHTSSSFAAAAALFGFSKKWGVPAFLLASFIAFSRIFLFVHWPTDVLAGIVLGLLCGAVSCLAVRKLSEARENKKKI